MRKRMMNLFDKPEYREEFLSVFRASLRGTPEMFHENRVYARMEDGRLKVGFCSSKTISKPGLFWYKSGDQVTEAYIQARLHLMGIGTAEHDCRMSEWITLPEGMTQADIAGTLDQLYAEAQEIDCRKVDA